MALRKGKLMHMGQRERFSADLITSTMVIASSAKLLPSEFFYLLGYSAMQSACEPTFRRNVSPPSSGSKRNQHAAGG
jgi:hypothetical protein